MEKSNGFFALGVPPAGTRAPCTEDTTGGRFWGAESSEANFVQVTCSGAAGALAPVPAGGGAGAPAALELPGRPEALDFEHPVATRQREAKQTTAIDFRCMGRPSSSAVPGQTTAVLGCLTPRRRRTASPRRTPSR